MNLKGRDFLKLLDFTPEELRYLLDLAADLKAKKKAGIPHRIHEGKNVALLFEKTSTRTRCAFEVAANDLGMGSTYISGGSQMGVKESIADTASVLCRMYDGIEYRGFGQTIVEELAEYSSVPVFNGLTDEAHPTQILADFLTIEEHFGRLQGIKFVYMGDAGFNMGNSLMVGAAKMGLDFTICAPETYYPADDLVEQCKAMALENGGSVKIEKDPMVATKGADVIYTDVWVSMGEPEEAWDRRVNELIPYKVTTKIMENAGPQCKFMHCLPAYHDKNTEVGKKVCEKYGMDCVEVEDAVFQSEASIVFDEAENRMHTIKAVMAAML